ncbi:hypothetical protein F5X97DRAFT_287362 [Nemania serpens]|nr:hypothetical protein F5X97DRAFT_287362 [Nemania serpens]
MDSAMTTEGNLGFGVNAPGTSVFVIQVVFLAAVWILALMRAFVKLVLLKRTTIDDYVMLLALLGYTATAYFVLSAVIDGGLGRYTAELGLGNASVSLRSWFGNMALSGPVSGLARISIALFLLRIAVKKWHKLVLKALIGVTAVMTTVYFFIVLFQCSPPSYFWTRLRKGALGSCSHDKDVRAATLVWGSFAVAMDWILGLLPIAMLWNVRINRHSKIGIMSILSFGIIAGIALIVRLVYVGQNGPATMDSIYGTIAVSISAIVELALGIMAGCIATLPPLFKWVGLKLGSSSKQADSTDTIPWQRSFARPESRHQGAENIILMSPRKLERAQDARKDEIEIRPRTNTLSTKRTLSSNWDIDIEVAGAADDDLAPAPSGKDIQVHTFIHVSSQPSSSNVSARTVDLSDRSLPQPPPRPEIRDRSIPRPQPLTPNMF